MATTRERIVTLRSNHPSLPAVRIAELLSVSRERVRPDYGDCTVCGKSLESGRKAYCSTACRSKDCRVSFRCDYCGESKEILQSVYNAQKKRGYRFMYCSIQCRNFGKWNVAKFSQPAVSVS